MKKLRNSLVWMLLAALAAAAVWWMVLDSAPDEVRALPLCERTWVLEFDLATKQWIDAETPRVETVVCEIEGATGTVGLEDEKRAHVDTPLEGQTLDVECYRRARLRPDTLPLQMPDGLYCNVPVPSVRRK